MKKKYLLLFILSLYSNLLFSQAKKKEAAKTVVATEVKKSDSKTSILEKIPFPQSTKSYPEVVYIIDDKPVDYRTYARYLQKKNKK